MPIIETGGAALGAIKSAVDIVRAVRESRDVGKLKAAINDLTAHLSDALSSVIQLQMENASLNTALAECQAANGHQGEFAEKAKRYVRKQSRGGAFVYVEKEPTEGKGPSPNYCAHCFENSNISVLQYLGVLGQSKCPGCGSQCKTG